MASLNNFNQKKQHPVSELLNRIIVTDGTFVYNCGYTFNYDEQRYMFKTRDILLKNRAFLEAATDALLKKETLLYSDISELRRNAESVEVAV